MRLLVEPPVPVGRPPGRLVLRGWPGTRSALAWNAILRATHASQFFTDAPLRLLPASWQDTGLGVLPSSPPPSSSGHRPSPRPGTPSAWPRSWSTSTSTDLALMHVIQTEQVATRPLRDLGCSRNVAHASTLGMASSCSTAQAQEGHASH
jgi:hypothetical protein